MKESGDIVIDLGLLAQPEARPPPGDAVRQVGAWWARRRRAVVCGLVAVLVLVSAAAAAPQSTTGVVMIALPPTGYGRFEVVGDRLFVAESDTSWRAYELPAGIAGWSLQRPDDAPLGMDTSSEGQLLDRLYGSFGATRDPATGTVVLSPDQLRARSGLTNVLVLAGAETALAPGDYRHYRDASPHPRFTRRATGQSAGWLASDPPVVVVIADGGLVELRTPATGEVLARRHLPVEGIRVGPAAVFDDTLVLQSDRAGELLLQGYERDALAALWERPVSRTGQRATWVDRCGPMLCIHQQAEGDPATVVDPLTGWLLAASRTEVVDPATGRTAWAAAGDRQLHPVGGRFLAYRRDGLLAEVVDPRTGQTLRRLTGWRAVVPVAGGDRDPLTLLRTDQTGHTILARLDLATLALAEVASLPGEPGPCQPFSHGLVCRHGHQLWVWTL